MKSFLIFFFLVILIVSIPGCDGYIRTIYLKEKQNSNDIPIANSSIILIKSNINVYSEIACIAQSLSLKEDTKENCYYLDGFSMYVRKKQDNLWEIVLIDWPEISRSKLSMTVERLIKEKLGATIIQ